MSRLVRKVLKRLLFGREISKNYQIGNVKHHNTIIDSLTPELVSIGNGFISAPGSRILTHDASLFYNYNVYKVDKVVIGDNVFLGANAVIMPGVTIGDNSIIGAGSIVTKNVESGAIVAGNPARRIGTSEEYYRKIKCTVNCVQAPESFGKVRSGKRLSHNDIYDFRKKVNEKLS